MTGTSSVVTIPSSSQLVKDIMPSNSTRTSSSPLRHCNTARGKRFTQKLLDAAKRSCHSEIPLPTPSTSSSLSPSPGICLDDDVLTDTSSFSCPSTPQQPTRWDKRLEKQQQISETPSLSAKPKRRKLKQQRTISWRVGADAKLDTNVVHEVSEQPQHAEDQVNQQQQPCQQPTRAAKEQAKTKLNNSGNTKSKKKQVITLGISGSKARSDFTEDDTHCNTTNGNGLRRHRRRRIDTVDIRLAQLMYAHDNLDLGVYSIVPKKATPPVYIDLVDDDDDNTKRPRYSRVRTENQANCIDLTLPSPSTTSASHTTEVDDQRNDCEVSSTTISSSTPTLPSAIPSSSSLPPSPESPPLLSSPSSLPTNAQQMQADVTTDTSKKSTPKISIASSTLD